MATRQTVVLTGANCTTAKWLIPLLKEKGFYTIGLVRNSADIGTDEVIPDWLHAKAAKQALALADVVIHLPGEINSRKKSVYYGSNVVTTRIVAENAGKGNARRIIFLSYPGASKQQKNLYLK